MSSIERKFLGCAVLLRHSYKIQDGMIQSYKAPAYDVSHWYDPFSHYAEGERPHQEFVKLAGLRRPRKHVLSFLNTWGLPRRDIVTVTQLLEESARMRNCVQLLTWVNESKGDIRVVQNVRAVMRRIIDLWKWFQEMRLAPRRPSVYDEVDPDSMPDEVLLDAAWDYAVSTFATELEAVQPVIALEGGIPAARLRAPDLLSSLYLMWYLELTRLPQLKTCQRTACGGLFLAKRKDQIYCSASCQHAEAARRSYQRRKRDLSKEGK